MPEPFDPDAFLKSRGATAGGGFDPEAFLHAQQPAGNAPSRTQVTVNKGAYPVSPEKTEQRGAGERFATGLMDPIYGMAQIGARMMEPGEEMAGLVTPHPEEEREKRIAAIDQQVKEREAAIEKRAGPGTDWWRILGEASNPALYAPALTGGLVGAAASGALAAAAQPETDTKDFANKKLQEGMWGGVFGMGAGAVTHVAGRTVSPIIGRAAQELLDRGVELTPGRLAGRLMSRMEDAARSIPWLGEFVRNAQLRSNRGFNLAAINTALDPIGEVLPPNIQAGRAAVDYAEARLGAHYDNLLGQPGMRMQIDHGFTVDMQNINRFAQELPEAQRDQFYTILRQRLGDRLRATGSLDNRMLKTVESEFGSFARDYRSAADPAQRQMGRLFGQVNETIRDALERQNPQFAGELQEINHGYAMFKRIQRASTRRAGAGGEEGVFTPMDLGAAAKQLDSSKDKAAYARGDALMQEFAEWGQFVMPSRLPDSGSPERTLWIMLGLGGAGAHAYLPTVSVPVVATLATAGAAYSRPGVRALGAYASPGAVRRGIRGGLERAAPATGVPGVQVSRFDEQGNLISPAGATELPRDPLQPNPFRVRGESPGGAMPRYTQTLRPPRVRRDTADDDDEKDRDKEKRATAE